MSMNTEPADPRCSAGTPLQTLMISWLGKDVPGCEIRTLDNGEFGVVLLSPQSDLRGYVGTVTTLSMAEVLAAAALEEVSGPRHGYGHHVVPAVQHLADPTS